MKLSSFLSKGFILFLTLLFLSINFSKAQNQPLSATITTIGNIKIEAFINKIDSLSVKYKKMSDPDGPLFSIDKNEITSISYSNGHVDFFKNTDEKAVSILSGPGRFNIKKLNSDLNLYTRKAARYKNLGYSGIFIGVLLTTVGAVVLSHPDASYTGPSGNTVTVGSNGAIGSLLVTAGLGAGIPLTIIGFTKNKRYKKKAFEVQNELRRRNEPISLRLKPGLNPATQSCYLSLKMSF